MSLSALQTKSVVIAASVALHVWIAVGVAAIRTPPPRRPPTTIKVTSNKPKPRQEPKKEEPPPAPKEAIAEPKKAAAPPPKAAPVQQPVATPSPAVNAGAGEPAEIGTKFSNSGPGLAFAGGGPAAPAPTASADKPSGPKVKALGAMNAAVEECDEPPAKPKPIKVLQPAYTDDARSAAIEGRVRVEITVDENGNVVATKVIAGLGHGLDEAALAAAKGSTFSAAIRCGKPVRSTFVIGMRFNL